MKTLIATILAGVFICAGNLAAGPLTPEQQAALDAQKKVIAKWAAASLLVSAVKAQNAEGPIPGMNNAVWAALKPGNPIVTAFEKNAAGVWLAKKLKKAKGLFSEAFLSAARGEKVAFVAKPTSYIHAGTPKFDVPMTGKPWQGEPALDQSSNVYSVQISTPVMDGGKPIGVLVVGVAVDKLK